MTPLEMPYTFPIREDRFEKSDTLSNMSITRIRAADPMRVNTYAELVDMVAKLAFFNRRYVLFFRGQTQEHELNSGFPTIYPTYFRKLIRTEATIGQLIEKLSDEQEKLQNKNHNRTPRFHGAFSIMESLHMRWALLQHYEICDTPLIDVTQSLQVAVSFALNKYPKSQSSDPKTGIIYVLALPWPSSNYNENIEEDIYLARLAGITPPQAKRPYRQEAFAVMSTDVDTKQTEDLERYDFSQRLVCKFEVNNSRKFWGGVTKSLPNTFLAPKNDIFFKFMKEKKGVNDLTNVR